MFVQQQNMGGDFTKNYPKNVKFDVFFPSPRIGELVENLRRVINDFNSDRRTDCKFSLESVNEQPYKGCCEELIILVNGEHAITHKGHFRLLNAPLANKELDEACNFFKKWIQVSCNMVIQ
jgi:hypothetical protein